MGYDTRFLWEKLAALPAQLLASHGIRRFLSQQAVPTPAIARAIRRLKTDGGADRFGILDEGGEFIFPNHILALPLDYLIGSRRWTAEGSWAGGKSRNCSARRADTIRATGMFH